MAARTKRRFSWSGKKLPFFVNTFSLYCSIIPRPYIIVNTKTYFLKLVSLNFSAYSLWQFILENDDSGVFIRCSVILYILLDLFLKEETPPNQERCRVSGGLEAVSLAFPLLGFYFFSLILSLYSFYFKAMSYHWVVTWARCLKTSRLM